MASGSSSPQKAASQPFVTSKTNYLLHNVDGMTFNGKMAVGTSSGNTRCRGIEHCQFVSFEDATLFCNNMAYACTGILQQTRNSASGCSGGLGCFSTTNGQLYHDKEWLNSKGKTFERQVLAYNRFQDGRKFSRVFAVGTRQCPGYHYCQFAKLDAALAFCDLDSECLGVLNMPVALYGEGCKMGMGCYTPARGEIKHDPLWLLRSGETYLKQQEVAYVLRGPDGFLFDGRFPAGTGGCKGVHNCQYQSLASAQAYCDANPTCKGVLQHTPTPDGDQACAGGRGCFEPCTGEMRKNEMFLVTEGKLYERQLAR